MNSNNKTARLAGLLYLLFIASTLLADTFGYFLMGETQEVINRITTGPGLFILGCVFNLFAAFFFVAAAWFLYVLLKPVNENFALALLLLNAVGVAMHALSVSSLFAAADVISNAELIKVFTSDQLLAQAGHYINTYRNGIMSAQLFFCTWLLPFGYLVYKSEFLPKALGILLIADFFAVLFWMLQFFLLPDYKVISYPFLIISLAAEFGVTLWLLIFGVKNRKNEVTAEK